VTQIKNNAPVIIIGAGHNGLTTAFYLARAGLRPLVLEQREVVGGGAVTEAIAPGYRCPTLAHATGPIRATVANDMELARRGVEFVRPDPRLLALSPDGRALAFSCDVSRTAEAILAFSGRDADRYGDYCATMRRIASFLSVILESTPPDVTNPGAAEIWELVKTGHRFRALGRRDGYRLLRWAPMAVADLVGEWFETDLLQAAIAARGIFGAAMGPWSAGTGGILLLNTAMDPEPGGSSVMVKGGPGQLAAAMAEAARQSGAEVQTGVRVARVIVRGDRAVGVATGDGVELAARAVISNADPRRTLLELIDPADVDPEFRVKARNYRCPGTVAKVNLALSSLPVFKAVADPALLGGRIHIGPSIDYLERAFDASKYGQLSQEPYLDIAIPTVHDPSLAPAGRHVMSIHMQFAPRRLAGGDGWEGARRTLVARALDTLERYAPGISGTVEHAQAITPEDLERTYGYSGGHILHGEPSLDQLFAMRPILGWGRYRTPIDGLYMCGAGTHPGGGLTAGPGQNAAREILKDLKT
jgi:phytoene dehydrogenase-like protein